MPFFRRKLGPIERFERALRSKQAERQTLVGRLSLAESQVTEKRGAAERLAKAGAGHAKLSRAEAILRSVEDRANALRAALGEASEQVFATERALADAIAQRDRELLADRIEALAAAIDQAGPGFAASAAGLVDAVAKAPVTVAEASSFSASVEQVSREVLAAADLVCWELRTLAARTRVGNANAALLPSPEAARPQLPEIERQLIYTLSPLKWQDGSELRKAAAFALVELPKTLLPIALQHQHVDYLSARRVKTLIQVHGSGGIGDSLDELDFIDLDALAGGAETETGPRADVA